MTEIPDQPAGNPGNEVPAVLAAALAMIYRVLAWTFGLVGLLFFLFPDGTVDALNASGRWLGFPPAPHLAHRFWLSLGVAYMAVVTALAALIARAPIERRLLMVPLALGKATSSLTCLWFFLAYDRYFVYLANFLVDASLALLAWLTYAATAPAPPGGLSTRARRVLLVVAETFVPARSPQATLADAQKLIEAVEAQLRERGSLVLSGFGVLLTFVDWNPRLFHARRSLLSEMAISDRVAVLEAMERSRWLLRRQAAHVLKLLLGLHAYSAPAFRRELHVDDDWLPSRLRLAADRRARGEKGPYPHPLPVE
ncbi:MAG: hypothetical protein KatS3mg077_1231 [Candidatus Binatia bacterium]|nr:MAG: hypothetical protein KatS3mg077_1231 [Candidatus Binatia bacterium]